MLKTAFVSARDHRRLLVIAGVLIGFGFNKVLDRLGLQAVARMAARNASFPNVARLSPPERARRAIEALAKLAPETATVRRESGTEVVSLNVLQVGDVVVVKPNERLPADGVVVVGRCPGAGCAASPRSRRMRCTSTPGGRATGRRASARPTTCFRAYPGAGASSGRASPC